MNMFRNLDDELFPAPFCRPILLEALDDLKCIAKGDPRFAILPEYYIEERVAMLRELIKQLPAAEPESIPEQLLGTTQPKDQ